MSNSRLRATRCAATVLILIAAAGGTTASTGALVFVSQWSRAFRPQTVTVSRGDTLEIVNDDSTVMHHAYIDDPDLAYDAGDQDPGGKAAIVFARTGTFTVLCGIHPKMQLVVTVRQ